jgi:hypothetical protein
MNLGTIIALDLPTSIILIFMVYRVVTLYKAKGMTLWLLIALNAAILSFACANIVVLIADKQLIEATPSELMAAYQVWFRA